MLPKKVQEWAGIEANGLYSVEANQSLAQDNDNGATFEQLAQIIEERF